jgi:hypothetical protein
MLLGRQDARWLEQVGTGAQTTRPHARSLTRLRAFLPLALILLFVAAYLAAVVMQAIELIR